MTNQVNESAHEARRVFRIWCVSDPRRREHACLSQCTPFVPICTGNSNLFWATLLFPVAGFGWKPFTGRAWQINERQSGVENTRDERIGKDACSLPGNEKKSEYTVLSQGSKVSYQSRQHCQQLDLKNSVLVHPSKPRAGLACFGPAYTARVLACEKRPVRVCLASREGWAPRCQPSRAHARICFTHRRRRHTSSKNRCDGGG